MDRLLVLLNVPYPKNASTLMSVGLPAPALAAAIASSAVKAKSVKPIRQICAQDARDSTRSVDSEAP